LTNGFANPHLTSFSDLTADLSYQIMGKPGKGGHKQIFLNFKHQK